MHAAPGGFGSPGNAAGIDRLSGHAGLPVDIGGVHAFVLIRDPGHLTLARAHVRGGHVLGRVDKVAFDQLIGETAGDLLQFVVVPIARIDAQPALGAAERRLYQGAFVGHQRGEGLDLVLVNRKGETHAALDRLHMFGMNRTVAGERVDLTAQSHPEADGIGCVAHPYLFFQTRRQVHQGHRPVEHQIDALAETGFHIGTVAAGADAHLVLLLIPGSHHHPKGQS